MMTQATHTRLAALRRPQEPTRRVWAHLALAAVLALGTATLAHATLKSARSLSDDIARATAESALNM